MKKILIISVGASPAVVTETVWKLFQSDPPFVPDVIHLVTTSEAEDEFERRGLLGTDGKMAQLFVVFDHSFKEPVINIPRFSSGEKIADIRTEEENILYGNEITRLVKDYASDPDARIHMSLAGGRKIMSWYAGAAMSLFGRPQDELSHVLVRAKTVEQATNIENSRDFWWPGQGVDPVSHKFKKSSDGTPLTISLEGVGIDMPTIPFIMLSPVVFGREKDLFVGEDIDYESVVRALQDSLNARHLTLHGSASCLRIGNETVELENLSFAIYCVLAEAAKFNWVGAGPQGIGGNQTGWLSYEQILSEEISTKLLAYYAETFGGPSEKYDEYFALFDCCVLGECSDDNEILQKLKVKNAGDAEKKLRARLETAKSKINKKIEDVIGNPEIRRRIQTLNLKDGTKSHFGLMLDPADIHFEKD